MVFDHRWTGSSPRCERSDENPRFASDLSCDPSRAPVRPSLLVGPGVIQRPCHGRCITPARSAELEGVRAGEGSQDTADSGDDAGSRQSGARCWQGAKLRGRRPLSMAAPCFVGQAPSQVSAEPLARHPFTLIHMLSRHRLTVCSQDSFLVSTAARASSVMR